MSRATLRSVSRSPAVGPKRTDTSYVAEVWRSLVPAAGVVVVVALSEPPAEPGAVVTGAVELGALVVLVVLAVASPPPPVRVVAEAVGAGTGVAATVVAPLAVEALDVEAVDAEAVDSPAEADVANGSRRRPSRSRAAGAAVSSVTSARLAVPVEGATGAGDEVGASPPEPSRTGTATSAAISATATGHRRFSTRSVRMLRAKAIIGSRSWSRWAWG